MSINMSLGEYLSKTILGEEKQVEIASFVKSQFELQVNSMSEKLIKFYVVYLLGLVSYFEWYFISHLYLVNIPFKVISPFGLTFRVILICTFIVLMTNKFIVSITLNRRRKKIELYLTQCLIQKYGNDFNNVSLVVDKRIVKKAFSLLPYQLSSIELVSCFRFKPKMVSI